MPNRIIRGDLLESDRYNSLTHDAERLLFMELLLLADDYGIVPVNVGFLRRRTTPCATKTGEQVTQMLSALADADLLRVYNSERGGLFAFIPRFDNRPQALRPKWPVPPAHVSQGEIERAQANSKGLYRKQSHTPNAPATPSYVAPETETETETEEQNLKHTRPIPSESGPGELAVIEKPAIAKPPSCPFDDIVAAYHELVPCGTRCIDLSATRKTHIAARWRQVWADERFDRAGGIEFFRRFFAKVGASKFLNGQTPTQAGRRPFLVSLPWLMGPENFLKVIEGRYS